MSYGVRQINNNGIVNIDEDSVSYVYLGKTQLVESTDDYYVHCVGYPLVFFGVPYNAKRPGEGANNNFTDLPLQTGIAMRRIRQAPNDPNTWIITMSMNVVGLNAMGLYLRVFGKLHLNFPGGSGEKYGARAWDSQGRVIFDTGCRQLRLSGDTYSSELSISGQVAGEASGNAATGSTVVGLPFDLAGKSVMANTRGTMVYPYTTGGYTDQDTGQFVNYISWYWIDTLFWATGNALYARKSAIATYDMESSSNPSVISSEATVYTRLAFIDNSNFP